MMTPIRSFKSEVYHSMALLRAEEATGLPLRLAFAGLFSRCDSQGRFKWQPITLKSVILPFDTVDFRKVLSALKDYGFIVQYSMDNQVYGAIPSWASYQTASEDAPTRAIPLADDEPFNPPLSKALRLSIYQRDHYACWYCGEALIDKPRSICLDYVIPLNEKGTQRALNLATSCRKCAALKDGKNPFDAGLQWPNGLGEMSEKSPPTDPSEEAGTSEGYPLEALLLACTLFLNRFMAKQPGV